MLVPIKIFSRLGIPRMRYQGKEAYQSSTMRMDPKLTSAAQNWMTGSQWPPGTVISHV